MPDLDPFKPAKQDARRTVERIWNRLTDLRRTYATAMLLKVLGLTAIAGVVAVLNFPAFAFALVALALIALVIYAVYATKLLKDQDRELRWAWITGKRVQQRELKAEISVQSATLALLGESQIGGRLLAASPELRSALAFHRQQLRLAEERAAGRGGGEGRHRHGRPTATAEGLSGRWAARPVQAGRRAHQGPASRVGS